MKYKQNPSIVHEKKSTYFHKHRLFVQTHIKFHDFSPQKNIANGKLSSFLLKLGKIRNTHEFNYDKDTNFNLKINICNKPR